MSTPGSVWRSAAVPRWLIALARLDEADEPLTAWSAMKREGERSDEVSPKKRMGCMRRYGLVEMVPCAKGWTRWRITEKGRGYLREGLREMSEFVRGDL